MSWTFDNGTTEKLIRDGTRAIDLMKYTTKDIKTQAPVLPDFSTHPATIAWGLSTDNKYAPQNFAQDLQDFLLFKHKEWYNDPETLFHICPRTKVDHDDFQPQGKYRGTGPHLINQDSFSEYDTRCLQHLNEIPRRIELARRDGVAY